MTDIVDPFAEGYKAPTSGIVDPFDPNYQPPKPVGFWGGAGRGFETTIGEAAKAAGDIAGAQGISKWGAELKAENAPVGDESTLASVGRGLGGLAAWLPAIAGTAAVLPEAAGAGAVGVGLNLVRGVASMALPAISSKVNTTSDMKEKGVDDLTASNAGWASAATTAAMGAVPVGLAGGLLKRATTGALSGLATGEAGRMAQNSVLSEHPELQQDFTGKQAVVESVIGAVLGGVMGHRSPVKNELDAARTDIEQQLNPEAPAPVLALPHIPEPMIGYPGGEVARKGQMEAYIDSLPEGERAPARARLIGLGSVEAGPETTIPAEETLKPAAEPTLNRAELSDIATKLFNGEGAIPAQYFAKATKEAGTLEETANRLRAQADALSDVPRNADRKDALNKLADHLDPQEKPANEQTETQTQAAEAKPVEAEQPKVTTPVEEVNHAIPVEGATEVPVLPEARAGEGVRGGNAEHEKLAGAEGNGPAAKQEEIVNPLLRAAAGMKPVKPEVKVEAGLPPREAGRESPFGENIKERAAAREVDMASREQAIRDRFAKGELTHPEATRMLGDLIAEGEEYKAWSQIEHDTSEPQMRERADGLGDKDAVDTQAALKDAKTVGEALTAVREHVSPKWQKFIDGLLAQPDAMAGKFGLSGISKTNVTNNMARLGEHSQGDVILHNGAGVSTLLHEAVHARTVWGIDHDPVFRKEVQAVFDAAKASGDFRADSYMFTNLHEFIAEAATRPEIQAALDALPSPKGKTLFGRLLDAIRKLLGLQPGQKSMLEDVLKMVEMAPSPNYPKRTSVLDLQYSERGRSMDFMRGPFAANKATQSVLSKAMDNISKLKPSFDTQYLKWSQLTHIADMTDKLFDLAKHDEAGNKIARWGAEAVNPIRDKVDNMMRSAAMAKTFNHTTKKLYDGIQGLNDKQRTSLYDLMGQYQLAKVFPNLKWEEHTWLTEADKEMYRRAKQLHAQPGVGRMYDEVAAHNKTLHDAGMASLIKSMGQIYNAPEHLWRAIDPAKGMGKEVKAVTDWSITEEPTTKDQFDQALSLHEAKKQEAYFSIGRDGDYMVNFHVKDTPAAHAAVQDALKRAGVDRQIVVKPGDTHVFSMFDTANEMLAVTKQLDILNTAGHLEKPYTAGKTVDKLRELDSSAPSFIRGMLAKIDDDPNLAGADPEMVKQRDAQKELLRRMYINMLPESSVSKFYARRSGTPGYSSDMARSFVKRAAAGAYFVSNHATRAEQTIAMARIRETAKDFGDSGSEFFDLNKQQKAVAVLNELNQRTANNLNPIDTPTQDLVSAIGHTFYLSASPSFVIQNLAQPYQITLPYLGGRHGFVASGKALAAAAKDVVPMLKDAIQQGYKDGKWTGVLDAAILVDRAKLGDPSDIDTPKRAAEKRALKALIASGRADWTQGGELSHIQEGQNPRLQNAVRSANLASYYGESLNRMQTALATFRLEMKKNGGNEAAAHERMISAVDDTQINYASENRARAIGKHGVFGSVTPLLFAFQQFNLGVMQTLSKLVMQAHGAEKGSPERAEAVKSLAGMLATTGVMAGTMGLPLVGAITGAYNALAGDENHPPDAATDYQNFLSDIVGPDGARVIAHGAINYVTGVDAASRLGQENLMPFTQLFSRFADSRMQLKDRLDSGALQFMGPMIGMPVNVAKGLGEMADGDLMKGAIQMAPSAIKGGLKATDLAEKGFTDSHGNKWGDATSWDVAVQVANFTPETKAIRNEAQQGVSAITGALHNRVSELENNFIKAYEAKDAEGRAQALADITEFRRAHPDQQINIGAALRKRAKEQAVEQMTGGVSGRIKQTPFIKEQTRYTQ